jgi:hypothetical protein
MKDALTYILNEGLYLHASALNTDLDYSQKASNQTILPTDRLGQIPCIQSL